MECEAKMVLKSLGEGGSWSAGAIQVVMNARYPPAGVAERIHLSEPAYPRRFEGAGQPAQTSLGQAQMCGRSLVAADGGLCSVGLGGLKADALNEVVFLLGGRSPVDFVGLVVSVNVLGGFACGGHA